MSKSALFRIFGVVVAVVALGLLPNSAWAQRGGGGHGGGGGGGGGFHGGGMGGFHGGGGSFHGGGAFVGSHSGFSGARSYAAYRGGFRGGAWRGASGWRGGWGRPVGWGWRGGYWGYPRYGWGWGGFGWPWWGWGWGYPSAFYGYPWYGPSPYYDPNSCPPGYSCPGAGDDNPPPNSDPNSGYSPRSSQTPGYGGSSCINCGGDDPEPGTRVASRSGNAAVLSVDRITATPSSYRVARTSSQQNSSIPPDVRNAMHHLREMPPFARQREIETGRYSHFSPQEKVLLRQFDQQLTSGSSN